MDVKFKCPRCTMQAAVPKSMAGKRRKCQRCGASITVPLVTEISEDDVLHFLEAPLHDVNVTPVANDLGNSATDRLLPLSDTQSNSRVHSVLSAAPDKCRPRHVAEPSQCYRYRNKRVFLVGGYLLSAACIFVGMHAVGDANRNGQPVVITLLSAFVVLGLGFFGFVFCAGLQAEMRQSKAIEVRNLSRTVQSRAVVAYVRQREWQVDPQKHDDRPTPILCTCKKCGTCHVLGLNSVVGNFDEALYGMGDPSNADPDWTGRKRRSRSPEHRPDPIMLNPGAGSWPFHEPIPTRIEKPFGRLYSLTASLTVARDRGELRYWICMTNNCKTPQPYDWPIKVDSSRVDELAGSQEVRVRNPNPFPVTVGLRSGGLGKDFNVGCDETNSVFVANGDYEVFFKYSTDPDAVYQGDNITLFNSGIEIQIVRIVNGNYGIRRVR